MLKTKYILVINTTKAEKQEEAKYEMAVNTYEEDQFSGGKVVVSSSTTLLKANSCRKKRRKNADGPNKEIY